MWIFNCNIVWRVLNPSISSLLIHAFYGRTFFLYFAINRRIHAYYRFFAYFCKILTFQTIIDDRLFWKKDFHNGI